MLISLINISKYPQSLPSEKLDQMRGMRRVLGRARNEPSAKFSPLINTSRHEIGSLTQRTGHKCESASR